MEKMDQDAKELFPLKPIYFLAPRTVKVSGDLNRSPQLFYSTRVTVSGFFFSTTNLNQAIGTEISTATTVIQ